MLTLNDLAKIGNDPYQRYDFLKSLGIIFPIRVEPSTAFELSFARHFSKYVRTTNGSPVTVTLTTQAAGGWMDDIEIIIEQGGAGQITIVAADGVTLRTNSTAKSRGQYSVITLKRIAENEWVMGGDRESA